MEEAKTGGLTRRRVKKMKEQWSAKRLKKMASAMMRCCRSLDRRFLKLLDKLLYPLLSAAEAVLVVAKLCAFYVRGFRL